MLLLHDPDRDEFAGIDVRLNDRVYYRIIQFDYVGIFVSGQTLNNVKVQTGFQFRF